MSREPFARRLVAFLLLGILPCLSMAVPLLDRGYGAPEQAVRFEPPSSAGFHHDHSICVLFAVNLSHPSAGATPEFDCSWLGGAEWMLDREIALAPASLPLPRGPPSA